MTFSAEHMAALRLLRTEGVGPTVFARMVGRYGSAQAALRHTKKPAAPEKLVLAEYDSLQKLGGSYVFWDDAAYPQRLAHIPDAPPVLTVKGNIDLLSRPQVAIVGSRSASASGTRFVEKLARDLAGRSIVVTSGLARGIDTAAHGGALSAQDGASTIAVLGGGLDHIYPPENENLFHTIAQHGLIVAETPPGTPPTASSFPRRNRIIAALSEVVVVAEAARRSGSLITARLAGEYGCEVAAIPGHPADPRAEGPIHLLKDGAHLVCNADDIIALMDPQTTPGKQPTFNFDEATDEDEAGETPENASPTEALLHLIGTQPVAVDDLVRLSGMSAGDVSTALSELELTGHIETLAGGRVVRV